jgi:hypothetical protein
MDRGGGSKNRPRVLGLILLDEGDWVAIRLM